MGDPIILDVSRYKRIPSFFWALKQRLKNRFRPEGLIPPRIEDR